MNHRSYDVALFGSVFVDHVMTGFTAWPRPGEEALATQYAREIGGGCFNTACGLAKLQLRTACFAVLGNSDGDWLLDRVAALGVGTEFIRRSSLPSGVTVSVSLPDDRTFFTFEGANQKLWDWLEDDSLLPALSEARHIHFAWPLPVYPGVPLIRQLRARGCTVSLDAGWHSDWLRDQSTYELLRELDYFLPNLAEAQALTGRCGWRDCLAFFRDIGARTVALKLGGEGAALLTGSEVMKTEAIPVACVDSTGAGDAFNAGFLHGLLHGLSLESSLRQAVICGSLSVRHAGSITSFPSLDEVTAFYEQFY